MRHALIEEMEQAERRLDQTERNFETYIQRGDPLETEATRREIDRLAAEWEQLNGHLQDIDNAILERHLRARLVSVFGSETRLDLWETGIVILIVVAVAITLIELFAPVSAQTIRAFVIADTAICGFLLADFFLRWYLAEDKGWYLRRYWIDLISSIPFYEVLRLGRIVSFARLFRLLRLLRATRVVLARFRNLDTLLQTFEMNLLKRAVAIAAVLLVAGALSIRVLERAAAAPRELDESLWWSFVTVVTGGFADLYNPETFLGQLLTAGLVLLGLAVTGIFTASLTSVLVEDEASRLERGQQGFERRLSVIEQKLDLLSGETNAGLIAMEIAAQRLSNAVTPAGVAAALIRALRRDFDALQASVHLLDETERVLHRLDSDGDERAAPPERLPLGEDLLSRLTREFLDEEDPAARDIEPVTEPAPRTRGMVMICPLVAGKKVLGMVHLVLPDHSSRYYLYNRAPMTLAHHAAVTLLLLRQNGQEGAA